FEVEVEPSILIWARESIGMTKEKAARSLNLSENTVSKWESGQKKPTMIQINKLARVYKRPLAAFFLSEPPHEPPLPDDFRTLPERERRPLSSDTLLAIRRARRLQSLAIELARSTNYEIQVNVGKASLSDNPEEIANKTRTHIGIDVQTQFKWNRDIDAFNEWKKAIETLGVLIIQLSLPVEETRGFSLSDTPPVIVINSRDHIRARIFSLFHEYGHLLLDTGGICDWENQSVQSSTDGSIEIFCNHFAGALLVPRDALLNHPMIKVEMGKSALSDECIVEIAKDFKVSREVVLRRLVTVRLADWDFYRTKYKKWKEKKDEQKAKSRHLFDIELDYKQYLKDGPPGKVVIDIFRKNNLILTDDARIIQKNDVIWEIRDRSRIFHIRDTGTYLEINKLKKGGQNIPLKCIRENGIPFTSLVFNSYRKGKITYNDVADYLRIRTKHIPKVEQLIRG
ncbi:MAG: ImmA/IrrE family metallo-endopeptidase, partial [Theionarchaea archaeon]|nr:ImmA/IrrE family metallo-endopeptidase [Theionarchaea archaeon]